MNNISSLDTLREDEEGEGNQGSYKLSKLLGKIGGVPPPRPPPHPINDEMDTTSNNGNNFTPAKTPPPRPRRTKQQPSLGRATSVSSGLDVGRPSKLQTILDAGSSEAPDPASVHVKKEYPRSVSEGGRDRPVSMSLARDNRITAMFQENEANFVKNFLAGVKKYAGSNKQLSVVCKYCAPSNFTGSPKRGSRRKKKKAAEGVLNTQLDRTRDALIEANGELDKTLTAASRSTDSTSLNTVISTLGMTANASSFLVNCMKAVVVDGSNTSFFKQVLTASRTVRDSLNNLLEILQIAPINFKNAAVEKQLSQAIRTVEQSVSQLVMAQAALIGGKLIPDWRRHEILGATAAAIAATTKLCWLRNSFTPSKGEALVEGAKVVGTTISQLCACIIDGTNSDIMVAVPDYQRVLLLFVDSLKLRLQEFIDETKTFLGSDKESSTTETPAYIALKQEIVHTIATTDMMAAISITKMEKKVPQPSKSEKQKAAKVVSATIPEMPPQPPDEEKKKSRTLVSKGAETNVWDDLDDGDNIIYTEDGTVKAATLNKLIEKVTSPSSPDSVRMMKTFIATYGSFTTPFELITKLKERFHVPPEHESDRLPVQLRVCNVLRTWVEMNFQDFSEEDIEDLLEFVNNSLCNVPKLSKYGKTLQGFIAKQQKTEVETVKKQLVELKLEPKIPLSPARFLTVFDEAEVARQLTLVEHSIYRSIKPVELLNQAWSKEGLKHRAPNVRRMIKRSTALSFWVASCILWQPTLRERARVMTKIINIGEHLRKLNNFNSIMALISGMNLSAVHRLGHTRSELSTSTLKTFKKLEEMMSSDSAFNKYRQCVRNAEPPCVPFLGVYLTDLTFSDDGSADKIGDLVHFGKRARIFNMIEEILCFQSMQYDFEYVDHIASFLNELPQNSDKDLYALSRILEPKGSDKKSIV